MVKQSIISPPALPHILTSAVLWTNAMVRLWRPLKSKTYRFWIGMRISQVLMGSLSFSSNNWLLRITKSGVNSRFLCSTELNVTSVSTGGRLEIPTEICIWDSGERTRVKAEASWYLQRAIFMKGTGRMVLLMALGAWFRTQIASTKVSGKQEKSKERATSITRMVTGMMETSYRIR